MTDPVRLLPVWRTHPAYTSVRTHHMEHERDHNHARQRANAKPRHYETRSKHVSLTFAVMRLNVYACISWLRAGVINGWLGTPAYNPQLNREITRERELRYEQQAAFIQQWVVPSRLRRGHVGGGHVPHRARGAPTQATETRNALARS
jgi:hypothetical protein